MFNECYMQTFMSLVNQEITLNKSLVNPYYLMYFNILNHLYQQWLMGWYLFVTVVWYLNTTAKRNYIKMTVIVPVEQTQHSYIFI